MDIKPMKSEFPYRDTQAALALQSAIMSYTTKHNSSLRKIAAMLHYRQGVTLSHMTTGRQAIPVERAAEIARVLEIDPTEFTKLVLKQRYPDLRLDEEHFGFSASALPGSFEFSPDTSLNSKQQRVMRELIADPNPEGRWLSVHEAPVIQALRNAFPSFPQDGLTKFQIQKVVDTLRS